LLAWEGTALSKKALFCGGLSLLSVLIGIVPLWGQEADTQGTQVLKEIVVTATGTEVPLKENGTSTTIITNQQMDAQQVPWVEDFIRDVPIVDPIW
jgi:outer membrane cobalamin receptor